MFKLARILRQWRLGVSCIDIRQHSDEDNYLSTTEIIERLAVIGIVCDRRTLYKDAELLNESGYEVLCEKAPGKPNGYCVADRSLNVSELRILKR